MPFKKQSLSLNGETRRAFRNLKDAFSRALDFNHNTVVIPLPVWDRELNSLTPTTIRGALGDWMRKFPRVRVTGPEGDAIWIPYDPDEVNPENPVAIIRQFLWRKNDPIIQKHAHLFDVASRGIFRYDETRYFFFGILIMSGGKVLDNFLGVDKPLLFDVPKTAGEAIMVEARKSRGFLAHENLTFLEFVPRRSDAQSLSKFEVGLRPFEAFCNLYNIDQNRIREAVQRRLNEISSGKLTWDHFVDVYPDERQFEEIVSAFIIYPSLLVHLFEKSVWRSKLPASVLDIGEKERDDILSEHKRDADDADEDDFEDDAIDLDSFWEQKPVNESSGRVNH